MRRTTGDVACRVCGTRLRRGAKFCDACGASATVPVTAAEFKQVTVLFADVVRSMGIAAALDIERFGQVMTDLLERSAEVVRRYGGTVESTGDGVMAVFGAPVALEDHAFRACLAALAIQQETDPLASEVQQRDGVALKLRIGLNSGQVIAGQLGSGSLGYGAIGEVVGFAQRMEAAAPEGGVLLSESTVQLVEHAVVLAEPEWVRVKGIDEPLRAHRLLAVRPREGLVDRDEAILVGRSWEMAALDGILDRAMTGHGCVVNVTGPPGIGKSRVAREVARLAAARGIQAHWAFCESHASDISFGIVAQLLRTGLGIADLDGGAARAHLRTQVPAQSDPQDLLLLDDLLGIADSEVPVPQIDPDARRRRLTALINTASLTRSQPALFVLEDAHWIDAVSESMLTDLLTVTAYTPSIVLITSRPEYQGELMRVHGNQIYDLAPLSDSDIAVLLDELLGSDPSLHELAAIIADRAAGNPFFAEEMVRELAQRAVLAGERGHYICRADVAEVTVPATVQAAIEARIDRLSAPAKRTLNAAAAIGIRFEAELLAALGIDPVFDELVDAELIDQVRSTLHAEYAFRHPLIRAVTYESQLKSDRAQWHRRMAVAIEEREPDSVEENASLIAEHLEAAGELRTAYGWHMRAATWSVNRNVAAARVSWERAGRLADTMPADDPDQLAMRIAPRTMLCATDYQGREVQQTRGRFAELRELCDAAGDKVSLAVGMTGLATELCYTGRIDEGSRLASEQMALLESIGDPTLTMGLAVMALTIWGVAGDFDEISQWSQTVVGLAGGDPAKGAGFGFGSPLAATLAWRGVARWWLGRPGWRQDHHDAVAMARDSDPTTFACVVAWTYGLEIQYGVLHADDSALRASEEAMHIAAGSSSDTALSMATYALGVALLNRDTAADRRRGLERMVQAGNMWRGRINFLVPVTEVWAAREWARRGDRDAAIAVMRNAVHELQQPGSSHGPYGIWSTSVLTETLLDRGAEGDLAEAEQTIDRLANLWADRVSAIREITLLRLRTLLARRRGENNSDLVSRYRTMAESLSFEGHISWSEAMTAE